jgi:hypothetical protein
MDDEGILMVEGMALRMVATEDILKVIASIFDALRHRRFTTL